MIYEEIEKGGKYSVQMDEWCANEVQETNSRVDGLFGCCVGGRGGVPWTTHMVYGHMERKNKSIDMQGI